MINNDTLQMIDIWNETTLSTSEEYCVRRNFCSVQCRAPYGSEYLYASAMVDTATACRNGRQIKRNVRIVALHEAIRVESSLLLKPAVTNNFRRNLCCIQPVT